MNLPDDLKDYRAPEADPFQMIAADLAFILLIGLGVFMLLFWPELAPR